VLKLSSHFSTHFIHRIQVNGSGSEGGILYMSDTRHKVTVQSVGLSNWKSCSEERLDKMKLSWTLHHLFQSSGLNSFYTL